MGDSYVVTGAMMMCSFGLAPSAFMASPGRTEMLSNVPKGNIMDFAPMLNIMPFGLCTAPTNPEVIACCGPAPCVPAIIAPWTPGNPQVLVQGQPALMRSCRNMCTWLGQISFTTDGQMPCPPPLVIPPINIPFPDLQPDWMLTDLEPHEIWQYKHDFEDAKHAGDGDRFASDQLKEMSARYAAQGDLEKATLAMQASEQYRNRADQKQAAAMQAVNDKYVWGTPTKEQPSEMSREDLQGIHDQAAKEQAQHQKEVEQLDQQIAKDQEALSKEGDKLAKVSREQTNARNELDAANQAKSDAADKREAAEYQAQMAAWNEESAKQRGDKEAAKFFHQQKKEAENTARQAAKEEKAASEKAEKAQKVYDKVSEKQSKAYNEFRDHVDQHKELKEQKKTAEENRNAAEQKANAAQMAIDAQDALNQHQQDINAYNKSKDVVQTKKNEMDALEKEEKYNRDESDAWFNAAVWNMNHGKTEVFNATYDKSTEYRNKANEAHQQLNEKEQEYKSAQAERDKAKNQAYGDDAMFEAYTAKLNQDNAMAYLRNNPSENTGSSESNSTGNKSDSSNSSKSGRSSK